MLDTVGAPVINGRYLVTEKIGTGGGSTVYLCLDAANKGHKVALKIVGGKENPEVLREFFEREVSALTRLRHDHIITLLDHGTTEGVGSWLALEYAAGGSLQDHAVRIRFQREAAIARLLLKCTSALAHAHLQRILHRDIKPSNILFDADHSPKVADFNVSRLSGSVRPSNTTVRHHFTELYAAPERTAGKSATEWSDVYSLGMVAAEVMLSDLEGGLSAVRSRLAESRFDAGLRRVVASMIEAKPEDRPTAPQLISDLEDLVGHLRVLPSLQFRVTGWLIDQFAGLPIGGTSNPEEVRGIVGRDLGAPLKAEVEPRQDNRDRDQYVFLGTRFRYFALPTTRPDGSEELTLTGLAPLNPNSREKRREEALTIEAQPEVVLPKESSPVTQSVALLEEMHGRAKAERMGAIVRSRARQELLGRWESYVEIARRFQERDETLGEVRKLDYDAESDAFRFTLAAGIPGDEPIEDRPVCYRTRDGVMTPVGTAARHLDNEIVVVAHANLAQGLTFGPGGVLLLDTRREQANIERQRNALRAAKHDNAVRPGLLALLSQPERIEGPSRRTFDPLTQDLDASNREAVELALGTDSLFLIQGPPGTGKTTVISELVAQICRLHPTARVLIASQSNIAVDNVLERLERLVPRFRAVRLGNPEKISDAAIRFELKTRLEDVVSEMRTRCAQARSLMQQLASVPAADIEYAIGEIEAATSAEDKEAIRFALDLAEDLLGAGLPRNSADLTRYLRGVLRLRKRGEPLQSQASALQDAWEKRLQGSGIDLEKHLLRSTPVVAGTCIGFIANSTAADLEYDWVIVDEAGRATAPELLVPLARGSRFILVGDHKQLPPILDEEVAEETVRETGVSLEVLKRSLFEELYDGVPAEARIPLRQQYRMHPEIGDLIATTFYPEGLLHGVSAQDRPDGVALLGAAIRWLDTSTDRDLAAERRVGSSFMNRLEADLILRDLEALNRRVADLGLKSKTVGVLAGYAAQVDLLRRRIDDDVSAGWSNISVEVATVDAAQGREYDLVYYSAVRSNPTRKIGFLSDERRLNVALSRAREGLTIVGDAFSLRNAPGRFGANPFRAVFSFFAASPENRPVIAVANA